MKSDRRFLPPVSRFPLAWVAALAVFATASAQEPNVDDVRQAVLDRLANERTVGSADGLVHVTTSTEVSGADALTLLRFVGDVRARLSTLLDEPLNDEAYTVRLVVQPLGEGAEPGVRSGTGKSPPGISVAISGLGQVRPEAVTAALCGAFLRVNALQAGWRDDDAAGGGPAAPDLDPRRFQYRPYPEWLGTGLARLLDGAARQDDAERAIARLEAGDLPPVAKLLAVRDSAAAADPALAAQLAAWLLDASPRGERFRALRRKCVVEPFVSGQGARDGFVPAAALVVAAGTDDPAQADAAWRAWLARRKWSILTPGSSHPAFVRRLRGLLVLTPPAPAPAAAANATDEPAEIAPTPEILSRIPRAAFEQNGGAILPEALVLHSDADWAPHAAMAMSGRILRAAAGHGDDVLAVARAYGDFFEAVRAREPRDGLSRRLLHADELLQELENKAVP